MRLHGRDHMYFKKIVVVMILMMIAISLVQAQGQNSGAGQKDVGFNQEDFEYILENQAQPGSEYGTNQNSFNYTIVPSGSFKPPQSITLTWLNPETKEVIYKNIDYWREFEPKEMEMKLIHYKNPFLGRVDCELKIGAKSYSIRGPYIHTFIKERLAQNSNKSWSYYLDLLSTDAYRLCPNCYFGSQQQDIGNCLNNSPNETQHWVWLIPKNMGIPNKCIASGLI